MAKRRFLALVGLFVAAALALSACTPGQTPSATAPHMSSPADYQGNITLWHFFTDKDADAVQRAVDAFISVYPQVSVTVKVAQDDDAMRAAIADGQNIDVVISYSSDQIGPLCSTGALRDLAPFIQDDSLDMNQIPSVVQSYTQFAGSQCALPMLTDATGLFYNKTLLQRAGINNPPKNLDELAADAKALTTHNKDGSIKTLGFMPLVGYYETNQSNLAAMAGAKWLNNDNTASAVGTDPAWAAILRWQNQLIEDLGGFKALDKWMAGAGDEFSPDNDFETGRLAMQIDGDYRLSMIQNDTPDLDYGTAPLPTTTPDLYGTGVIDGNIIGIPKGSLNPQLAWQLVKYLAMDTNTQLQLSDALHSLPTTNDALAKQSLTASPQYQTFLNVLGNPNAVTEPRTVIGTSYADIMAVFIQGWQSGSQTNLAAGLADVDQQINQRLASGD